MSIGPSWPIIMVVFTAFFSFNSGKHVENEEKRAFRVQSREGLSEPFFLERDLLIP